MVSSLIEAWRKIIGSDAKTWVLFGHGTVVIFNQPETDPGGQAVELMKSWGPVVVGTPAGDFNVITASQTPGWLVTCHHTNILTYVSPDEVESPTTSDWIIGLIGRSKRDQDAQELEILHIENVIT